MHGRKTKIVHQLFTFIMCGRYISVVLVQIIQIPMFVCIDYICEISGFCCNRVPTIQTLSCLIVALRPCMTLVDTCHPWMVWWWRVLNLLLFCCSLSSHIF